jgi:hypothetical protein
MATTTNYGWTTPNDTDLVKDGASAIRTLGQSIDTTFAELKGGTSGQMLTKASNTDLDLVWITPQIGDITSITATSPLTGGGTTGDVTVGIQAGSTTQSGALQLTDSTSSTSTTTAATPNSVKSAFDTATTANTTANAAIAKSTVTTAGDIIYRNATVPTRLGIGTAGQVLTVNAGATAPEWATASGSGGMTLLSTTTLSGTTTTISSISGSYKNLYILIKDFNVASNTNMLVRLNGDATAANYQQGVFRAASATNSPYGDNSSTGIDPTGYAFKASTNDFVVAMTINNYAATDTFKSVTSSAAFTTNASDPAVCWNTASYKTTTAISSLGIFTTVGTWVSGTVLVYGVN